MTGINLTHRPLATVKRHAIGRQHAENVVTIVAPVTHHPLVLMKISTIYDIRIVARIVGRISPQSLQHGGAHLKRIHQRQALQGHGASRFPPLSLMTPHKQHRSEEQTSEIQSRPYIVCRFLLEKKKTISK